MERVRGSPLERTTSAPGTSRAAPSAATALSLRTISSVFSIGARASALRTAARTSARFSLDPRSRARSSSALAFALSAVVLSRGATSLNARVFLVHDGMPLRPTSPMIALSRVVRTPLSEEALLFE